MSRPDQQTDAEEWLGNYIPYSVGNPGRAAGKVQAKRDRLFSQRHDHVVDGAMVSSADGQHHLVVRAASVRGLAHRYYGVTRQDDYLITTTADGRHLLISVADGLSSGRHSHVAAQLCTTVGTDVVERHLATTELEQLDWTDILAESGAAVGNQLAAVLASIVDDADDIAAQAATVLYLVVALKPDKNGAHQYVCARIGDVSIWTLDHTVLTAMFPATQTAEPAYASSTTNAIPSAVRPGAIECASGVAAPGTALIAMTDGIGDPLGSGTGAVGRFLADQWQAPVPELQFAAQVDFGRASHDDDRTAVAVWVPRRNGET